jgi:hypothetical protein
MTRLTRPGNRPPKREEFFIGHGPAFVDKWLADRQAHWLDGVLAEEHEREREKKHPDRIELPD